MTDLLNNLSVGFEAALTLQNLLYALIGAFMGTAIGVLPGVGPLATVSLLLPATFALPPLPGLIMLAGIYYGAQYGGSTTSILVNLPGEASSVVTTLDGYQMARKGRAGPALAVAGIGSFIAGCVGVLLLAVFAEPMTEMALSFGPWEYFSLMLFGLIGTVALASGSALKAIGMILVGILVGMIGVDVNSGMSRFAMGSKHLIEGIDFVVIAMGLFGLGEIIKNLSEQDHGERDVSVAKVTHVYPTKEDWQRMMPAILRGTAVGSALGVLPGAGGILGSFASYALEKKLKLKEGEVPFGQGNIRGVAGPESANNGAVQTAFIPMLTLGIPPNGTLALMIGAMTMHNITPGPQVMTSNPDIFWGLVASMWIGNVMLLVLNLPLIGIWVRMLSVPYRWLFPAIVLFCSIGVFSVRSDSFDIWLLCFFAAAAFVLIKFGCESAPLLLGVILGPMMEENLRRAMVVSKGSWGSFVDRPVSATLLVMSVLLLVFLTLPALRKKRDETFVDAD